MAAADLTAARLRELLHYDPWTGLFTRLQDSFAGAGGEVKMASIGDVAGSPTAAGYVELSVDSEAYLAHRLAVLYVTGDWPPANVDHEDGDGANNRWLNLRRASQTENMQNLKSAHADSSTGLLGVSFCKSTGRWRAQIRANKKRVHIGRFDTPEEAHEAYLVRKRELHPFSTL